MSSHGVIDQLRYEHPPLPKTPITFDEFLAWADEDTHAEWVDGEIVLMSPSNLEHNDGTGFLYRLISDFVESRQLGWVFFAEVLMRLPTRPSGRMPDVLFVATAHADRLRGTYLDGPADLVVEIVSPESVERDRVTKLAEYERAGIAEYWIVDPTREEAVFHQLGEDGRYQPGPIDAEGFYHSAVLRGFRLRVAWLWQRPLPTLAEVTRQIEV